MKLSLTIKLTPESRDEALAYSALYDRLRAHFEDLLARGDIFPPGTTLRWLLETVRFE